MSMISKQIEDLRKMAEKWRNPICGSVPYRMCGEAADTIEALSAKVRYQNMNASQKDAVCYLLRCNDSETPNSSDLISRQAAIDAICNEWCYGYLSLGHCPHENDGFKCDGCDEVEIIESLPSADAVEVVRCKDCRHKDLFSCPLADNDFQKDEDYCSWGERREDGEE